MPLRGGESVGSAYVRIYADGSEVPGDIRRAIEEAEPSVRDAGREHGRTYADEFDKESRKTFKTQFGDTKKGMFADLNDGLTDSLAKIELSKRFFEGPEWRKFKRRLGDEFGEAGRLAGTRLEAQFRDSTDLSGLADRMKRIAVEVRKAQSDILAGGEAEAAKMRADEDKAWDLHLQRLAGNWAAMLEEAHADNVAFNNRWRNDLDNNERDYQTHINFMRDLDEAYNEHAIRLTNERDGEFEQSLKNNERNFTAFQRNMTGLIEQVDRVQRGDSSIGRGRLNEMLVTLRNLAPNVGMTDHELVQFNESLDIQARRLRESTPLLSRFERGIDNLGDRIGRLFGRGSRNNFLNFFGSFVGSLARIPKIIPSAAGWITRLGRSMSQAFTDAGGGIVGGISALGKGIAGVGSAALTAGAGIVAFAGFIGVLGLVLGPVVALLSGLAGIVVALAGSLAFAVSSLVSFAPLLVPLVGIIGGIVLAVKKFKDDAGPLGDLFDDLQKKGKRWVNLFSDEAFKNVGKYGDRLMHAFGNLGPLFTAAGKGFNQFLNQVTNSIDSGGFKHFTDRFTQFLPHAMSDLGTIIGNTLGGIGGILTAAIPSANRLLDWLTKITEQFSNWANSQEGRREIKRFLERAGDSAKSFGDFLEGAWNWLTKLIDKSKGEGDTLWERIGGKFQEWADYIEAHPDAFKNWMEDADELATSIGNMVDALDHLVGVLDTADNRKAGTTFLNGLADGINFVAGMIDSFQTDFLSPLMNAIKVFGSWLGWFFGTLGRGVWYVVGGQWVGDMLDGISDAIEGAAGFVGDQIDKLLGSLRSFGSGGGGAMIIKPSFDPSAIANGVAKLPGMVSRAITSTAKAFGGLAGRAASAAGDIAGRVFSRFSGLPSRVQGAVDQVVARFGNIVERIGRTIGDVWGGISSRFTSVVSSVQTIANNIVDAFRGLATRILAAIGPIVIHPTIGSIIGGGKGSGEKGPATARGGMFSGAQTRLIAEAGPEAVVPLNRPLSQVDPSVRMLSAIAQGLAMPGTTGTPSRVIDNSGWTIVSNADDPRAVAAEVFNTLMGAAL